MVIIASNAVRGQMRWRPGQSIIIIIIIGHRASADCIQKRSGIASPPSWQAQVTYRHETLNRLITKAVPCCARGTRLTHRHSLPPTPFLPACRERMRGPEVRSVEDDRAYSIHCIDSVVLLPVL